MPSPTYRAQSLAAHATATSTTNPPTRVVGDVLVALVNSVGGTGDAPAGWTLVADSTVTGTAVSVRSFYRVADGTSGDAMTLANMPTVLGGHVVALTSWNPGSTFSATPLITSATAVSPADGTSLSASITVAQDATLVGLFGGNYTTAGQSLSSATGLAEYVDDGSTRAVGVFGEEVTAGTHTETVDHSDARGAWHVLAIRSNTPPNAPTGLIPASGNIDRTAVQRFSWTVSDPDTGDTQSKADLRYRIVGAASWTDLAHVSPAAFYDFAGSTFAAGDYEWQVRTYDAQGLVGPYSSSAFFSAVTPPVGPTITTPANASTVTSSTATLTWSYPTQQAYQVRKVADLAGSPDTATVYFDSGVVESSSARSLALSFPTNNRTEHLQVRVRDGGLWSPYSSVRVAVAYTVPEAPLLSVLANSSTASIGLTIDHRPNLLAAEFANGTEGGSTAGLFATANATTASSTAFAVAGTRSIAATAVANGATRVSDPGSGTSRLPVTGGVPITAEVQVRAGSVARDHTIRVAWYKTDGSPSATSSTQGAAVPVTTTGFTKVAATLTPPADAALARIDILSATGTLAGEVFYYDQAQFKVGDGRNLLPTRAAGSFEDGTTTGYDARGLSTLTADTTRAMFGGRSLRATYTSTGNLNVARYNLTALGLPDTTYTVSAYVYVPTGVSNVALLYINTLGTFATAVVTAKDQWVRVSATVAGLPQYFDFRNTTAVAGQAFWVDGVQIEAGSTATAYTDPLPWSPGGTPAVQSVDIYRRELTVGGDGIRVATGLGPTAGYTDRTPASGVAYEYRVRAVATSGATADSTWAL